MDQSTVVSFLRELGVTNTIVAGDWVRASCPLAPWTHKNGTDKNPSFGVRVSSSEDDGSIWHCFGCSRGGSLDRLLNAYQWASRERAPVGAVGIYLVTDGSIEEAEHARKAVIRDPFTNVVVQSVAPKPLVPMSVLNQFPPLDMCGSSGAKLIHKWLTEKRLISPEVVKEYGLRLQRNPLGIVYPICNRNGDPIDLWVRLIKTKKFYRLAPKITGSSVAYRAVEEWFGWQFYKYGEPVTQSEGGSDLLRLRTLGVKNVVASFGPPSKLQFQALYNPVHVLAYDADDSGYQCVRRARKYLKQCVLWRLDFDVVGRNDPGALRSKSELVRVLAKKREYIV